MEIKLRRAGTIYVIDINGEMDLYNAFKVKDIVMKMIGRQIKEYVINLENVEYLDSSGIGALLSVHAELKKRGMPFVIANVKGSVKRVIELTKLNGYLPISADVNEAVTRIRDMTAR
ncbi:MAG: STAS domain-containing protein [Spirochaetia bacterium]|jgi:anti-sigma B factor antagonist